MGPQSSPTPFRFPPVRTIRDSGNRPGPADDTVDVHPRILHPSADRGSTRNIVLLTVAALVIAAVAVVVTLLAPESAAVDDGLEQYQDVEVSGDVLAAFPGDDGADPAVGVMAPVVTGASFDGTPVTIGPGQPTLVAFVAHWCPHCQAEVPRIVDWLASGDVPAGLEVVAVSTSATSTRPNFPPSAWLEDEGFDQPVLADDVVATAAQAFGLQGFPMLVLLDADGTVLWRVDGELPEGRLAEMIASSLPA